MLNTIKNSKYINSVRIILLCTLGYLLIFTYSIARPTMESLFLQKYGAGSLPKVWFITSIVSFIVLWCYNKVNIKFQIIKIFAYLALISLLSYLLFFLSYKNNFNYSIMALYVWKEVYMVVMIEVLWTFADIVLSQSSAKKVFGIFLIATTFGSLSGNLLVGKLAILHGTAAATLLLIPLFILLFFGALFTGKIAGDKVPAAKQQKSSGFMDSLTSVYNSKYLFLLLFIIVCIQIATSLIEYKFSETLVNNYANLDQRTNIFGNIHAAIDIISLILQLLTAPILRIFGVNAILILVPSILFTMASLFIIMPTFNIIMSLKVAAKSLDYSLFRAAKEILYSPLPHIEKTQGKGLIDIFVYRLSKGFSSLLLMAMTSLSALFLTSYLAAIFICFWLVLTLVISKRYRAVDNP